MKLTKFETQYIATMLWSSVDDNGDPLDDNYSINDLAPESIEQIQKDCDKFIELCGDKLDDIDDGQAGHDFWLTRNHHGAGFWDRGLGELGEQLTELSQKFPEQSPYIGDDGKVYL